MSNESLRTAERRWHTGRTHADRVRWLLERLRAGELTRRHITFAAFVGDRAAIVVADPGARWDGTAKSLVAVAGDDLDRKRAVVNGLLRGARAYLRLAPVLEPIWSPALDAIEGWVRCPCAAHVQGMIASWGVRRFDPDSLYGVAILNIGKIFQGSSHGLETHAPLAMLQLRREGVRSIVPLVARGIREQILAPR